MHLNKRSVKPRETVLSMYCRPLRSRLAGWARVRQRRRVNQKGRPAVVTALQ